MKDKRDLFTLGFVETFPFVFIGGSIVGSTDWGGMLAALDDPVGKIQVVLDLSPGLLGVGMVDPAVHVAAANHRIIGVMRFGDDVVDAEMHSSSTGMA